MSSSLPPLVGSYHKTREKEVDSVSGRDNALSMQYFESLQAINIHREKEALARQLQEQRLQEQNSTVTVDKGHYESLLRISQQFENLKRSLLGGGVSRENFDVLTNDGSPSPAEIPPTRENFYLPKFLGPRSPVSTFREGARRASATSPPEESVEEDDSNRNPAYFDNQQRTVDIRNLPERTTHQDLTDAIRGGALVEIYLRYTDNSARVAFADVAAAREFLDRAKRQGFRIGNKRVDVSWSDRQFFLRPYIKQNLAHGASRNLAIHNINPNITAALIRENLEHIHNLVVIDIKCDYQEGTAYISTNSVHNAMFARSCMKSRVTYRGMKIEFAADECARPYEPEEYQPQQYQPQHYQQQAQAPQRGVRVKYEHRHPHVQQQQQRPQGVSLAGHSLLSNRFDLLSVDSESPEEDEEDSDLENSGSDTETDA